MRRFASLIAFVILGFSIIALFISGTGRAFAQSGPAATAPSDETSKGFVPQNSPCADQPRSLKELKASFEKGRRPLATEMTGVWVEIGQIIDARVDFPRTLNCSGITQQGKLEFVLIASGYSVDLRAVGMAGPQTETMKPNREGSVEFPEVYFGGEVAQEESYRCRLSGRGTLVCLMGAQVGEEFKKMAVEKDQIYEP